MICLCIVVNCFMVLWTGIARLSPKEEEESDQGESRSVKEEETTEHEEKPLVTVPAVFRRPFEPVSFSISCNNTTDLQIRPMCILKARISELARLCYNEISRFWVQDQRNGDGLVIVTYCLHEWFLLGSWLIIIHLTLFLSLLTWSWERCAQFRSFFTYLHSSQVGLSSVSNALLCNLSQVVADSWPNYGQLNTVTADDGKFFPLSEFLPWICVCF